MSAGVTPRVAALRLGKCVRTIHRWIHDGTLRAECVKRRWYVSSDAVDTLRAKLAGGNVTDTPET